MTLRGLSKLSELDHAYIHRLETGAKMMPSDATVKALNKALRLDRRQALILISLLRKNAPEVLVQLVLVKPEYALEDFELVAAMSHPGTRPKTQDDWVKRLDMAREMREQFAK